MFHQTMILRSTTILITALALAGCGGDQASGGDGSGVDLQVSSISMTPGLPLAGGEDVTITVVVANTGTQAAPASTLRYTFKDVPTLIAVPAISAGGTASVSATLASDDPGSFPVAVKVNADGAVSESDQADNQTTRTITWTDLVRNLSITSPVFDDEAQIGSETNVSFQISSQWDTLVGGTQGVNWRIVRVDAPTVALAGSSAAVPTNGSTAVIPVQFEDEDGVAEVEYRLEVDFGRELAESAENDNVYLFTVNWTVTGPG